MSYAKETLLNLIHNTDVKTGEHTRELGPVVLI